MVTGIGYCARRGSRKRERQLRELCENPRKFHFYPPLKINKKKITVIRKDGKKISIRK
jgi:hypothetical protein